MVDLLISCEFSGRVREAFRKKGINAVSCDLLDSELPGPHIKGDVLDILDNGWDGLIAFPPCTYLAVSGASWFKTRQKEQEQAIDFFMKHINADIKHICVENPVSIMSTVYRKPDQYIQPWMFGHGETKRTCLWLKNLPRLQPSNIVDGREQKVWKESPGKNRWKNRSRTYQGIADAMANQWSETIKNG